jgi:hypothetical protein
LRGWLDLAPRAVLRLAAVQLRAGQRKKILEEVWIPDLMYVLRGKESRPITRLIRGMWFAVGLLISILRGRYSYQPGSNTKATPATNEDVKQARESWQSSRMATPGSGGWQRRARGARGATPSQSVNMQPGESLVLTVRMHPAILLRPIVLTLTGLIIAALLSVSGLNGIGLVLDIIWLAWGALLLGLAWKIADWSVEYLVVTSRRIILANIGYGELIVASGGNEQSARRVPYIPYPNEVYQELVGAIPP